MDNFLDEDSGFTRIIGDKSIFRLASSIYLYKCGPDLDFDEVKYYSLTRQYTLNRACDLELSDYFQGINDNNLSIEFFYI